MPPKPTDLRTQSEVTTLYVTPSGEITDSPKTNGKANEVWGVEYYYTQNDGTRYQMRRPDGAPEDGSQDQVVSTTIDTNVASVWNQQNSNTNNNTSAGTESVDREGNATPEPRWVTRDREGNIISSDEMTPQQSQGRREEAERTRNATIPAKDGTQIAETDADRAARNKKYDDDQLKEKNTAESNRLELIKIQTAQRLAGVQEAQLAQSIDDAKKPQKLPDGTFVAWDKNENGEWIARKVNNATSGPKGMAESHDSALADMRLGTVAKASQNYMTELLRRTSLPPNDPEFMTSEQASAAMTSFIAEGDQFLREQQGLLGEQNKVQTAQLTQRNQDLMEVQSRRNFQQTNVQQAAQHDTEVNKYLPAGSEHLAGPGFLGQIMLTNNLAGQYGGMDAVPQIQQTPMQSGLMGLPSFAVQDLGPGTIPGPPRTAPVLVNPQQPMPGIIAPQ